MNGRLEKERKAFAHIEEKLVNEPEIFKNYYRYMRSARKTYSTITTYINGILRFAHHVYNDTVPADFYSSITIDNVEEYIMSLETTDRHGDTSRMSGSALATNWSYLHSFWNFLVCRGYAAHNIVERTTRPKNTDDHTVTFLTPEEIREVCRAIEKEDNEFVRTRNAAIFSVGIKIGLRCSAVMNLNIEDLDFSNHLLSTVEKGNKIRRIAMGENLERDLKAWLAVRERAYPNIKTSALFLSNHGLRMSTDAANDMLTKYVKRANINKHITFHKTRASLATNALHNGVPLLAVSQQLGHADTKTTMRYLNVYDEDRQKLTDFMDKI